MAAERFSTALGQIDVVSVLAFRRGVGNNLERFLSVEGAGEVEAVQLAERFLVGEIIFPDHRVVKRVVDADFRIAGGILRA